MRAIVLREFGPAENLRLEDVEDPQPGPGQARIAVKVAGVHFIDTKLRQGGPMGLLPQPELPAIPGREVAGVVDAVGPGVDDDWIGRRVVAHLGPGSRGYAAMAVREVEALHVLPDGLADDAAVAMIGTGRTTMAILDTAAITAADTVLITAAAGGIGTLLVQAAGSAGARVIARRRSREGHRSTTAGPGGPTVSATSPSCSTVSAERSAARRWRPWRRAGA